jgi:hypothetical protein
MAKAIINKHVDIAEDITREMFVDNFDIAKGEIIINNDETDPSIYILNNIGEITKISGNQNASTGEYNSNITDDSLKMVETFGDFKAGTTVGELRGKTYDELFDGILFPTVVPTFTAPKATISFQNYSSIQEVGALAPTIINFKTNFDKGAIKLNGVAVNYRSGELVSEESKVVLVDNEESEFPTTIGEGIVSYRYKAVYEAGPQPYDNKGNEYNAPLASGITYSSNISVSGVYPWFASTNGTTDTELKKQALISKGTTTSEFVLLATAFYSQVIETPAPITYIALKDNASGNFIESTLVAYDMTEVTKEINGTEVTYYRYEYDAVNFGDRGEITLKIKFNA